MNGALAEPLARRPWLKPCSPQVVAARERAVAARLESLDQRTAAFQRAQKNGLTVSDQAKLDKMTAELDDRCEALEAAEADSESRAADLDEREAELTRREKPSRGRAVMAMRSATRGCQLAMVWFDVMAVQASHG